MPELPEVEVTRQSFADRIQGARVLSARLGKPLRWPLGIETSQLTGCHVLGVRRRGKYLLLDLAGPGMDGALLLLHLGMSGSLSFVNSANNLPAAGTHDHFDLFTSRGVLRLNDPRRFGAVVFAAGQGSVTAQKLLGHLGMEPLDDESPDRFDLDAFCVGLKSRTAPIKQVLLAGELVVGVGNIYASESLFIAGIRPTTKANAISRPRAILLFSAIREVLARAVQAGGSTLKDFSSADGKTGYFQLQAAVYGRAGEACRRCAATVKTIRQGQRATFFCPVCQKK